MSSKLVKMVICFHTFVVSTASPKILLTLQKPSTLILFYLLMISIFISQKNH